MLAKTLTTVLAIVPTAVLGSDPTSTTPSDATKTLTLSGVTHSIVAGLGAARFDPDNVVAEIGDVVEWHFLPMNHSVVQSSFGKPCAPRDENAFFSGFFKVDQGQSENVFQIVVKDKNPLWYYCAQAAGSHCQNGMVGVINQDYNSLDFTLARHKLLAQNTCVSVAPAKVQGGEVIKNPSPLSGYK